MLARKISASSSVSVGRNGRNPAGALMREVTANTLPCRGRVGPPKVVRGGVTRAAHILNRCHPHPARKSGPTSPLQGEVVFAGCWSSRDLPGGAVLGVFEHHA